MWCQSMWFSAEILYVSFGICLFMLLAYTEIKRCLNKRSELAALLNDCFKYSGGESHKQKFTQFV